jgi:hypothetical protein
VGYLPQLLSLVVLLIGMLVVERRAHPRQAKWVGRE